MQISTQNSAPGGFTAQCWITGAAGFTDAGDPNAFPPDAARVITSLPEGRLATGTAALRPASFVGAHVADGTSASVRFWWYDDAQAIWIPGGAAGTLTYATTNSTNTNLNGATLGRKWFLQVAANTAVTKIAFLFR